ncbi:MAG: Sec-independent protein translocase protein TatB [Casimicrobiaceae bacterium]
MFDIAFSEITLIAVVALIVIGPERLPKVAKTLGHMYGRLQRYVNEVKTDISREMELDELRKLKSEVQSAAQDLQHSVSQAAQDVESGVRSVEAQLSAAESEASAIAASDSTAAMAATAATVATPGTATTLDTPATPAVSDTPVRPAPPADAESPRQAALPGLDRI